MRRLICCLLLVACRSGAIPLAATSWDATSVCKTSTNTWQNIPMPAQTGAFTVEFDATPTTGAIDGVVGLSNGWSAKYSHQAAVVRFNLSGKIDARSGGVYRAVTSISYSDAVTYHFRMVVSLLTKKYSAYVKVGAGAEQTVATDYAFRTEQTNIKRLDNIGLNAAVGSLTTCYGTGTPVDTTTPPPVDTTTPPPSNGSVAELPRTLINTAYPTITGSTITVNAGGNLQTAINNAVPGDQIVLQAGATFTGNFVLPAKTGTGWIVIKSGGTLPAAGTRITPASAAQMAKLITPAGSNYTIAITGNAGFYRLVGLELAGPAAGGTNQIFMMGTGSQSATTTPHDIIVDRSWVHGYPGQEMGTCLEMNSASTAIIDSYIDDCHSNILTDGGYAIRGGNGPGPYKIVNNYISGSGLNIFFGGVDPSVTNLVPSDIEIRRNYLYKPAAWKSVWKVKNILESKNSQRVLVEGNILDGNWLDGQDGVAINLKSSNQNGACTWCVTQDWTIRYNKVRNAAYGAVVSANPTPSIPAVLAKRITFQQNIFDRLNQGVYTGQSNNQGLFLYFGGAVADLVAEHNTAIIGSGVGAVKWANFGSFTRFKFSNNIVVRNTGGVFGCSADPSGCGGEGTSAISTYAPSAVFAGNAIIGATASIYPTGNFFPTSVSAVGFANPAAFDWTLTSGSSLKGQGTDGTDPGANISAVNAATAGVE